jgi:hypothetical protein
MEEPASTRAKLALHHDVDVIGRDAVGQNPDAQREPRLRAVSAEKRVPVRAVIVPARHKRLFATPVFVTFGHGFGCVQPKQGNALPESRQGKIA